MSRKHWIVMVALITISIVIIKCSNSDEVVHQTTPYDMGLPDDWVDSMIIPKDNPLTVEGVNLGRLLFYDPIISGDNSKSCGSCHHQEFSFADGNNRFSTGIHGDLTKRNTSTLMYLAWNKTQRFFWDGRAHTLEELSLIPIKDSTELDQHIDDLVVELKNHDHYPELFDQAFGKNSITAENIAKALAQFLRTIVSNNSTLDDYLNIGAVHLDYGLYDDYPNESNDTSQEIESEVLDFIEYYNTPRMYGIIKTCQQCHGSFHYGAEVFAINGIFKQDLEPGLSTYTDSSDFGKFKAPSLRNIALSAPYMHDGRFATLEEVVDHYNEHLDESKNLDPRLLDSTGAPIQLNLTEKEKAFLILSMTYITDSSFMKDERFSDPFSDDNFNWDSFLVKSAS